MRTLYLLRSHGTAGVEGEQVVVRCAGEELERIRLPMLDQILVMGNLQLTTPLIRACLTRGVVIAYLSRHGWCHGRLQPVEAGYRHRARYQALLRESDRLQAAASLLVGKVANGRTLLQRLTRRQRDARISGAIDRLQWHLQQLPKARSLERLMGLEGNAAAEYFDALGGLIRVNGYLFEGRHRRPPTTPFDALCGFGYSLLWNAQLTQIELQGLDPYEGVLHSGSPRHAALVSDLIEPLRTLLVDPFNVWLIRTRRIRVEEHFEARDSGIFLNEEGRRLWLRCWSTYMSESVRLSDDHAGPRWELLDRLARAFVRFVYDLSQGLTVPRRR
ncbi:CRISPR-associated endonuclease Cas1 [Synechococcus sp. CS-1328]|nr:CRISPR-associated endonuclease Cas1 [Synechococcus sp. CS-1328]